MSDIKEIEAYAYQHNVPIMMDDGLEFLLGQMKENHCRSFLEIGTAVGRTSLVVHDTFEGIRIVTIERNPEMIAQAKQNFAGKENITLIEGCARSAITKRPVV